MSTEEIVRHEVSVRAPSETPAFIARADAPEGDEGGPPPLVSWPVVDAEVTLRDIPIESGARIDELVVRYRLEGEISPARDNVVLVVHALTGTVEASDWWRGVIAEGSALDPTRHAILCANVLGGCTGTRLTGNAVRAPFPEITTRDQALVMARLLDALDVEAPLLICGGSLGGMIVLEFAASFPERLRSGVALAAPAVQTAQGFAWGAIMRRALDVGGEREGLALARMVGMLSYRTPTGLESRFGAGLDANGRSHVAAWLHHHGDRLVGRFTAASYRTLIDAMDRHDVGRERGGWRVALTPVASRLTGAGVIGDILYHERCVEEWALGAGARYRAIRSPHGHDAFLLEISQVAAVLREAISRAEARNNGALDE